MDAQYSRAKPIDVQNRILIIIEFKEGNYFLEQVTRKIEQTHLCKHRVVLSSQRKDWHSALKAAGNCGSTGEEERWRNIS